MLSFRLAHPAAKNRFLRALWLPYLVFYKVTVEWLLCIELPYRTKVGKNFFLGHGQALVINVHSVIGENCFFRHSTTLGNIRYDDGTYSGSPVIGNNVELGSNVCIIGEVRVGNNVKIGAGSVVVRDIPDNSVAVGNPARVIRTIVASQPAFADRTRHEAKGQGCPDRKGQGCPDSLAHEEAQDRAAYSGRHDGRGGLMPQEKDFLGQRGSTHGASAAADELVDEDSKSINWPKRSASY